MKTCEHTTALRIVGAHGYELRIEPPEGFDDASVGWVDRLEWCPACGAIRTVQFANRPDAWRPCDRARGLQLELEESDRQLVLLALAVLSLKSPGFDDALNRIARRIDTEKDDRAVMYDQFRELRRDVT